MTLRTALWSLGVVAVALGALQAVEAILGTNQATVLGVVAVIPAVGIGGWLVDREADRRRADRFAQPTIRRREIVDVRSHPVRSIE